MKIKATKRWFTVKYVNGQQGKVLAYTRDEALRKAFVKLSSPEKKEFIKKYSDK